MRTLRQVLLCALLASLAAGLVLGGPAGKGEKGEKKEGAGFRVPVEYYKLPNGLRVVLSEDHTSPTVVVAVYYRIGFRIEPRDRTGFAHLFEHMMFQGSENLGKMEFIKLVQSNGGVLNGSTRFDFTNYFQLVPANKLETVLWAEADRMRGLSITQENLTNQIGVVTNEVKVNVLNQPYGGFPWLDMPQVANTNWHNAHNFYGDLKDLESATLEDVKKFFSLYYAPNNAALVVVGDFEPGAARELVKKYFGGIPAGPPPKFPDLTEPRQEKEKQSSRPDRLATRPALAFAYHMPPRNTPEYWAMGLLDQLLLQGDDSLLRQKLVKEKGYTGSVEGGINLLGNMYDYDGPMLWMASLFHDAATKPEQVMEAVDQVIEPLRTKPLDAKAVEKALVKLRSDYYSTQEQFGGFGRADLLASLALFDDDPSRINGIEAQFRKVTPDLIRKTAEEYLRRGNRTVLTIQPQPAPADGKQTS